MSAISNQATDLSLMFYKFFGNYLIQQRRLSHNTIAAYRDSLRLYLLFLSVRVKRPVARLCISDLQYDNTLDFLQSLEEERYNSVRTGNNRLAAIKCFLNYITTYMPEAMPLASKILAITQKNGDALLLIILIEQK